VQWFSAAMSKRRGIWILSIVVAAAIGASFFMRRGGDGPSAPSPVAHGPIQPALVAQASQIEPARLVVTVRDTNGPIADATVRCERGRGEVELAQTGKDGVARFGNLEPGTWTVSAAAESHEPAAARERELHAGEVVNLELALAPGGRTLTGIVTDATGGPISGARIDAAKLGAIARPSDAVASTLTGSDGRYKLAVAEGQLLVAASEPSYAPQSRFVEVGTHGATADFQLVPGGVIEGVVRDERTREPVGGAVVTAQRDAPAMLLGERALHEAKTGSDGRFRMTGLRPGAYDLAARALARTSTAPTIVGLGVAEQISDVEILISRGPVIRGLVVDDSGAPAADVEVTAFGGPGNDANAKTDGKGAFVLEGLAPGRYMLMARSDALLPAGTTPVELATRDLDGVKVHVRRGLRIQGHVEPRQICEVQLDIDETALGGELPVMFAPVTTGPDGAFDIGLAHAGSYQIVARCASGDQGRLDIAAKPGMAAIVVAVMAGASIAGKVVDGQGKPVAGVAVMAAPTGGTERTTIVNGMVTSGVQALTNAAGAFELRGLGAGAYRLGVLDRGRPLPMKSEAKVTLTAVEQKTGVVLAVDRADGVLRGVVTGADGKPLADAWVSVHQDLRDMVGDVEHGEGGRMVQIELRDDGGDTGGMPPALTDASGKFEIRNLPRVPWTVVAEAQAGKLRGRAVRVVPDADISIQAVGLTELRGKVVAPGGPPPSFQVALDGPTRAQRSFAAADGTFSFSRVEPGDYTVSVTSSAGNGRATVKIMAGQTANVEITLAANAIVVGKLVDNNGKPVGGVPLAIVPDSGDGRLQIELEGPPPTSSPDGTFRLEGKAGPSVLVVMVPPQPISKRGLNLEAGKTLDVGSITVSTPTPPR
jgi:protocatechuate 3,4-dioxygenase beta subunit